VDRLIDKMAREEKRRDDSPLTSHSSLKILVLDLSVLTAKRRSFAIDSDGEGGK